MCWVDRRPIASSLVKGKIIALVRVQGRARVVSRRRISRILLALTWKRLYPKVALVKGGCATRLIFIFLVRDLNLSFMIPKR
jgi:hypothetical protein